MARGLFYWRKKRHNLCIPDKPGWVIHMANWIQAHRRLLTSARLLKAFYETKLNIELELLTEAPVPVLEGDLRFSESVAGYGLWGLRPARPLPDGTLTEIREMCDSILGGIGQLEEKREALERMQLQMERALNGDRPSNVIAFHRKPAAKSRSLNSERIFMLKLDCLIEASDTEEVRRMAMEIHAQSSRVAFVEHKDLDSNARQSITQLLNLGPITLFIPDILELSLFEQEILRHLLRQPVQQRPLLMVGCVIPYSELRGRAVDEEFLTLLARAYIKLTRPFSEYKDQGLIHYFLDSLSSDPT